MTRSRSRTTALRVLLAITFVWLTASYLMGAAFLLPMLDYQTPSLGRLSRSLFSVPLAGAFLGAPFLVMAGIAWILLHRAGRATAWLATASGAGVGAAVAVALFAFAGAPLAPMITALVSAPIIGWLAWRIAYGGPQPDTSTQAAEAFS